MRTFYFILFSLLVSFQIAHGQKNVSITGMIANSKENELQLGDYKAKIDSLGHFRFHFQVTNSSIYILKYKNEETEIYLQPNDSIIISFNDSDFKKSITYRGNSVVINNYLANAFNIEQYLDTTYRIYMTLSEDEYINKVEKQREIVFQQFESFINTNKSQTSAEFINIYKISVNMGFNWIISMFDLCQNNYISTEDRLSYYKRHSYITDFDFNNSKLQNIKYYNMLMESILRYNIYDLLLNNAEIKKSDNQRIEAYFKAIKLLYTNAEIRNYWLYKYLKEHINNYGVKNIENLIKDFNIICLNQAYLNEINEYYQNELKNRQNHLIKTYKEINGFKLDAHIFIPKDIKPKEKRPAIVYFHGGGFVEGKPDWHFGYNEYGFVSIAIEYRLYYRQGAMPLEEISDAKSAIRWIRQNADELHVDTNKIIASGNSDGGALVIGAALTDSLNEPNENLNISSKPNAMIINAHGCYITFGPFKDKERLARFSGINLVKPKALPCLVIHGTKDYGVPIADPEAFVNKMRAVGNFCEFKKLDGAGHVPWLYPPYSTEAWTAREEFLKHLGYINK